VMGRGHERLSVTRCYDRGYVGARGRAGDGSSDGEAAAV
jgi:hypothetical protein